MKTALLVAFLLVSSSIAGLAQSTPSATSSDSLEMRCMVSSHLHLLRRLVLRFPPTDQTANRPPRQKVARQIQHMQRVEELLERIAVALERK
jgi:hypothetical protein